MDWTDKQIWKQCFISTFICLLGFSIGAIGLAIYLINYNWIFVLLASFMAGFIACMALMIIREITFRKMNLKDAISHTYKISLVSILIMIVTEIVIMVFISPKLLLHQIHVTTTHNLITALFALGCGFLLSLPYNYYQLQKIPKVSE